ncbi:MAG: hypothetical protein V3V08_10875 [Nannocystaceae bacterium]
MKFSLGMTTICAAVLFAPMPADAQSVTIGASATTGDPGDVIKFDYSYDLEGQQQERLEITFDGAGLGRTDVHGGTNASTGATSGTFTWPATAGTHAFRLHIRTNDGTTDHYLTDLAVINIAGWETSKFVHPGLLLSEEEIDEIEKKLAEPGTNITKTAWQSFVSAGAGDLNHEPLYDGWEIVDISPGNTQAIANSKGPRKNSIMFVFPQNGRQRRPGTFHELHRSTYFCTAPKDENTLLRLTYKWLFSGEDKYAEVAIRILNAWAAGAKTLWGPNSGKYAFLTCTHNIYPWVIAPDLLKSYKGGHAGWSQADRDQYDKYARDVLAPITLG